MKERAGCMAPPGSRFVAGGAILTLLAWGVGGAVLGVAGLFVTAFLGYFFRDPEREVPGEPGAVVSPADGRVIAVETAREEHFLKQPVQKISIFMNIFDVHVNRAPVAGRVRAQVHIPGRYVPADRPEAPRVNEQLAVLMENEAGQQLVYVQVAGLLARRIIPYVQDGDQLAIGERVGLICFGSRVDLYLPPEAQVTVGVGERLRAGVSIVGRLA